MKRRSIGGDNANAVRKEALGDAMSEWQRVHGAFTQAELDKAGRVLDRAAKRRRTSAR